MRWLPPTTSFTLTKPGSAQRFATADSARVKFPLWLKLLWLKSARVCFVKRFSLGALTSSLGPGCRPRESQL